MSDEETDLVRKGLKMHVEFYLGYSEGSKQGRGKGSETASGGRDT